MNITDNADNGQQAQVAIHVSEFNGVADWVLAGPAVASQRSADHGHMRRVRAVALVKHAPAQKRNSESLEVSAGGDAEIRVAQDFC